jgi:hypothetical protein
MSDMIRCQFQVTQIGQIDEQTIVQVLQLIVGQVEFFQNARSVIRIRMYHERTWLYGFNLIRRQVQIEQVFHAAKGKILDIMQIVSAQVQIHETFNCLVDLHGKEQSFDLVPIQFNDS